MKQAITAIKFLLKYGALVGVVVATLEFLSKELEKLDQTKNA